MQRLSPVAPLQHGYVYMLTFPRLPISDSGWYAFLEVKAVTNATSTGRLDVLYFCHS